MDATDHDYDPREIIREMARQLSLRRPDGSPAVYAFDGRFYLNATHLWGRS
jgi:hypothetical protein